MIDGFSIKTGEKSDAAAIRNLVRKAYAKWVPLIGRDPLPMSVNYEQVILSHRFDLVYKDKTLVALIETIEKTDHLLIQNLCVSPKHQRVGVGRSLLNYAEYLNTGSRSPVSMAYGAAFSDRLRTRSWVLGLFLKSVTTTWLPSVDRPGWPKAGLGKNTSEFCAPAPGANPMRQAPMKLKTNVRKKVMSLVNIVPE